MQDSNLNVILRVTINQEVDVPRLLGSTHLITEITDIHLVEYQHMYHWYSMNSNHLKPSFWHMILIHLFCNIKLSSISILHILHWYFVINGFIKSILNIVKLCLSFDTNRPPLAIQVARLAGAVQCWNNFSVLLVECGKTIIYLNSFVSSLLEYHTDCQIYT